jgi:hypothetical protein
MVALGVRRAGRDPQLMRFARRVVEGVGIGWIYHLVLARVNEQQRAGRDPVDCIDGIVLARLSLQMVGQGRGGQTAEEASDRWGVAAHPQAALDLLPKAGKSAVGNHRLEVGIFGGGENGRSAAHGEAPDGDFVVAVGQKPLDGRAYVVGLLCAEGDALTVALAAAALVVGENVVARDYQPGDVFEQGVMVAGVAVQQDDAALRLGSGCAVARLVAAMVVGGKEVAAQRQAIVGSEIDPLIAGQPEVGRVGAEHTAARLGKAGKGVLVELPAGQRGSGHARAECGADD